MVSARGNGMSEQAQINKMKADTWLRSSFASTVGLGHGHLVEASTRCPCLGLRSFNSRMNHHVTGRKIIIIIIIIIDLFRTKAARRNPEKQD